MTFDQLLESTPTALHLIKAVEVIQTQTSHRNSDNDQDTLAHEAFDFLRLKAAKGDVEAKIKLCTILEDESTSDPNDKREAAIWARSVFDRRLSGAILPCVTELGANNTGSQSLLDTVLQQANDGQKTMCHLVGLLFLDGIGLDQDTSKGVSYLQKAADAGHEAATVELASIMSDPFKYPNQYNLEQSLERYESVASKTESQRRTMSAADVRALTDLARVYYEGSETLPRDIDKAYRYARRVAENVGEQYCQFIVGDALLHSLGGIAVDVRQAIFWLTQSGEQGFPLAVETLARIYFEGHIKGIQRDFEQAHYWCMKGDDLWPSGLGYCQTCLGDMYRAGMGVPKDLMRSFEYYQKAASQQDAPQNYARYMLGEMFYLSEGWQHNHAVAAEYYKLAANENYQPARQRLEELAALEEQAKAQPDPTKQRSVARKSWSVWSLFRARRRAVA